MSACASAYAATGIDRRGRAGGEGLLVVAVEFTGSGNVDNRDYILITTSLIFFRTVPASDVLIG